MAIYSIADLSGALPTVYREMVQSVNRKVPALRLLSKMGKFKRCTTGPNATWNVNFSGQAAGNVNLDGGAFITPTSDVKVPASLALGTHEAPVKVTDRMQWQGSANGGLGQDINAALWQPIEENTKEALESIVYLAGQQLFSGSGSSNQMSGFATSVASSGIYANINSATYTAWVSTVSGNSGTLRSLSLSLIKNVATSIASASGNAYGRPDLVFCRPALMDALENLFDPALRINTEFANDIMAKSPASISTVGGRIGVDGFRVLEWSSAGLTFVEDPSAVDTGATNPNNTLFFCNSAQMEIHYTPPPGANMYRSAATVEQMQMVEQQMGPLGTEPLLLLKSRGRNDHSDILDMTAVFGLVLKSRAPFGKLQDVQ